MKTNSILSVIVLTTTLAAGPVIAGAATPETSATSATQAEAAAPAAPVAPVAMPAEAVNPMPTPNQIIYLPQLPTAATLVNVAAAQKLAIEQINQTSTQITVVYKFANGQTNTICYQLLSAAGAVPAPVGTRPVVVPAQTTVIYGGPAPVYYYDPFYYPYPWAAPVSVSLGFGFRGGYYHGGYYHRWHGWH